MTSDPLKTALIALARELEPSGIELIIGGGYGLLLRGQLLPTTLTPRYNLRTEFRSTSDLDCFLGLEIVTDSAKMKYIAESLTRLGYEPVEKFWMFAKTDGSGDSRGVIKVDLLAADVPADRQQLMEPKKEGRRIRPRGFAALHARRTPEAITIERQTTRLQLEDEKGIVSVLVPHSISFVLMKLFAFRDRLRSDDAERRKDAPYHAFDILFTLATIGFDEWESATEILRVPEAAAIVIEATQIVTELFGSVAADGIAALREYSEVEQGIPLTVEQLSDFVRDLKDLFSDSHIHRRIVP